MRWVIFQKFSALSNENLKACILHGPNTRQLMKNKEFSKTMNKNKKEV